MLSVKREETCIVIFHCKCKTLYTSTCRLMVFQAVQELHNSSIDKKATPTRKVKRENTCRHIQRTLFIELPVQYQIGKNMHFTRLN